VTDSTLPDVALLDIPVAFRCDRTILYRVETKYKTIPVAARGGQYDCETSRLSHFLDSRLKDGGEVVSLTSQAIFVTGRRGA
jgi:hypothetical protein